MKKTLERQLILQRYLIIKVILKQTPSPLLKTDVWQISPSLEFFLLFKVLKICPASKAKFEEKIRKTIRYTNHF